MGENVKNSKWGENGWKFVKVRKKGEKMRESSFRVGRKWEKMGENLSRSGENERKWEKICKSWEKTRENGKYEKLFI